MVKRKGFLQKLSLVFSGISFVLSLVCGVWLYFRLQSVGSDNPVSASLMASTFFFLFVGFILGVIGSANLPSFKVYHPDEKKDGDV